MSHTAIAPYERVRHDLGKSLVLVGVGYSKYQ